MKPVKNTIEDIKDIKDIIGRYDVPPEPCPTTGLPEPDMGGQQPYCEEGPLLRYIRQHPMQPGRVEYRWVEDELVPWREHDHTNLELRPGCIIRVRNFTSIQETPSTRGEDSDSDLPPLR